MKNRHWIITWVCLAIFSLRISAAEAEVGALEAMTKAWVESYNSNKLATMMEFYEDSDKLNILVSVGVSNKGKAEYKKLLAQDLAHINFFDSKLEKLSVREMDEFGVVAFVHKFKAKVKQSGEIFQVHIRTTMTWRKIDGKWQIIQEHSSPIIDIPRHKLIDAGDS